MVKATVKINKANKQKTLLLGKDTDFEDNEVVEVSKVKELTENDLDEFYKENKDKLEVMYSNIVEIENNHSLTHEYKLAEWFQKEFSIEITGLSDECYGVTCGGCSPGFESDPSNDGLSVDSPVGFIDLGQDEVEDMCFDSDDQFEDNIMIHHKEVDGYSFHPENLDKERILDSMKIKTFYELEEKKFKATHSAVKEQLESSDFEYYCWGGEFQNHWSEFTDVLKHKELDIYLCVWRDITSINEKRMFLCLDKENSKEIFINQ